jgi:carbon monoxide dehydrogenase subunit G
MAKIESKVTKSEENSEKLYNFVTDFNNFEELIPADKVKNWEAEEESCSFTIDGIGSAGLRIIEKEPTKLVKISSEGSSPISFLMWIQLKEVDENDTRIKITIDPQVNMMMMTMVKKPLKQFVNMLAERMAELKLS